MSDEALSAQAIVRDIRAGRRTAVAVVEACLARIAVSEPVVKAWSFLDAKMAFAQARALDAHGASVGPLHGVPVGLKDIIDTAGMPTECGTPVFEGRRPAEDAVLVSRLKAAGAIILGKTKTTELAYMQPTDTTNPHNPLYSPGGSSSGSAAAVAAGHVPLAVGTQTGGSVVRPASFCGVCGMKPTYELVSRQGVFQTSETLDHVGGFAASIGDLELLMSALGDMSHVATCEVPRLAWLAMPYDADLPFVVRSAFEALVARLGAEVYSSSEAITGLAAVHKTIYDVEITRNVAPLADATAFSDSMQAAFARAAAISDAEYDTALAAREAAKSHLRSIFERYDAVLTSAAPGEAPALAEGTTGSAICNVTWSLMGNPAITVPCLIGETQLPVGLQVIGAYGTDLQLLGIADKVAEAVRASG